jgi:hypothetical protein
MNQELITREEAGPAELGSLFPGAQNPLEIVKRATEISNALAPLIEEKKLFRQIGQGKHVYVEAWTMLGSMLGVFAVPTAPEAITDEEGNLLGYKCYVEARTLSGQVVGAGTGICMADEANWKGKPHHALESMAETRGASKALRRPLNFIIKLSGYDTTPAEEMPDEDGTTSRPPQQQPRRASAQTRPAAQQPAPAPAAPPAAPAPAQPVSGPIVKNSRHREIMELLTRGREESTLTQADMAKVVADINITREEIKGWLTPEQGNGDWISQLDQERAEQLEQVVRGIVAPETVGV